MKPQLCKISITNYFLKRTTGGNGAAFPQICVLIRMKVLEERVFWPVVNAE